MKAAIDLIKHQGEGSEDSPNSTDPSMLAHYYRFKEIATGHRLVQDPATGKFSFTGAEIPPPATFPMAEVPPGGYRKADVTAEVSEKLDAFDQAYTTMLNQLQAAWQTGTPSALTQAISTMRDLGDLATALMQIPIPGGKGNYGPCFRLITAQPPPVPSPGPGPLAFAADATPARSARLARPPARFGASAPALTDWSVGSTRSPARPASRGGSDAYSAALLRRAFQWTISRNWPTPWWPSTRTSPRPRRRMIMKRTSASRPATLTSDSSSTTI